MKPESERESCAGKLTWNSLEEARAAAAYAVWQYGDQTKRPRPYRCKFCNKWHLTHAYSSHDL